MKSNNWNAWRTRGAGKINKSVNYSLDCNVLQTAHRVTSGQANSQANAHFQTYNLCKPFLKSNQHNQSIHKHTHTNINVWRVSSSNTALIKKASYVFCHHTALVKKASYVFCHHTALVKKASYVFCHHTALVKKASYVSCHNTALVQKASYVSCHNTALVQKASYVSCHNTALVKKSKLCFLS